MQIVADQINKLIHAHAFAFGVFVALFSFVFFAGGLVVANGQTLAPSDSHVVSLYVDGEEQIVPTRAKNVEDLLAKTGVTLRENDIVEPSIKTEITDDNFKVQVYRAQPITIVDGNTQTRIMSPHASPRLAAEKAGVNVYPEDITTFSDNKGFVSERILGKKLVIDRATPVTLSLYGTAPTTYRTQATTIEEFLKEKNITPEPGATITPAASTPISASLPVFVSKPGKKVVAVEESVPFATESTNDPTQSLTYLKITRPGVKGKKQVVYEVEEKNGRVVSKKIIQQVVTEQPVSQLQIKGSKSVTVTGDKLTWMRAAGISESDFVYVDFIVGREGGWNGTTKWNRAGSGAYGICQALPASKMASAGADYMTNPVTQLKWCSGYAKGRYGSWAAAYSFWRANHWW